jgi:hypothetical protein
MKHTLAENLLRFGVKNLSEANIKTLQEQETTTPTTPGTKPPAPTKKVEIAFNCGNGNNKYPGVVRGYINKQPDGSFKPGNIVVGYPDNSGKQMFFTITNINNVYSLSNNSVSKIKTPDALAEWIRNYGCAIDKPILPITAIQQTITQLATETQTKLSIDPTLKNAFAISYEESNVNGKSIQSSKLTGALAPFGFASINFKLNPQTLQEMPGSRQIWLGDGTRVSSNMYAFKVIDGKLAPVGGETINMVLKKAGPNVVWPELKKEILNLYNTLNTTAG